MAQIFCKIELDVTKSGSGVFVMAKQGDVDSRFVQIRLVADGKPFEVCESAVVVCAAKREDGTISQVSGRVNGDGTILVPIGGEMLADPGIVTCDVGIIGEQGERLTATAFYVAVEAAILPTGIPGEAEESLFGEFFAQRQFYPLSATTVGEKAIFSPLSERNYNVDLSAVPLASDGTQRQIVFALPEAVDNGRRAWIYLHLTATEGAQGGFPTLDFGENVLYCDGKQPIFASRALDVVCSFSPLLGKWLLRPCIYENEPREQLTHADLDAAMDTVQEQLLGKADADKVFKINTSTSPTPWQNYLPYQTRNDSGALVTGILPASVSAAEYAVAMYGGGGQLRVPATPSGNTDAASKGYVDAGAVRETFTGAPVHLPETILPRELIGTVYKTDGTTISDTELSALKVRKFGKNLEYGGDRATALTQHGLTIQYLADEDCYVLNGTTTGGACYELEKEIPIDGCVTITVQYVSGTMTTTETGETAPSGGVFYVGYKNESGGKSNWRDCPLKYETLTSTDWNKRATLKNSWFFLWGGITFTNYKVKVQVEKGTTATAYEPSTCTVYSVTRHNSVRGQFNAEKPNETTTTLTTNTGYGVEITCTHDAKKYIDKKFAELQALVLGG